MPSKNTSVITARVKDETALKLAQIAENKGITVAKLIDEMVENLEKESLSEKGVTPDGYAVSEDFDELYRYKELRLDRLIDSFERHKYPDHEIRRQIENMLEQIDVNGNYNPRRAGGDWS